MSQAERVQAPRLAPRVALALALALHLVALASGAFGRVPHGVRAPAVVAAASAVAPLTAELVRARSVVEPARLSETGGGPDGPPALFLAPPAWSLASRGPGREAPAPPWIAAPRPRLRPRSHVSARGPPCVGCAAPI